MWQNFKCDKTICLNINGTKIKMGQNSILKNWQISKTQYVTKLKNLKCDKTQKLKMWQNSKTKRWQKSKCDKTQNSISHKTQKTQNVTKLKKFQNSKSVKTQKLNML